MASFTPGNFLPEDASYFLDHLKKDIPWKQGEDGLFRYPDSMKLQFMKELTILCEEMFECYVLDTWCYQMQKEHTMNKRDWENFIIYSFGGNVDMTWEEVGRVMEPVNFGLKSGDVIHLPDIEADTTFALKAAKGKNNSIIVVFQVTEPYGRNSHYSDDEETQTNTQIVSSSSNDFGQFSSIFPQTFGTFSQPGGGTSMIIDAESDYGKKLMEQISAQLARQGIQFSWDD